MAPSVTPRTMQRVVFEFGHCLLPHIQDGKLEDYAALMDDQVRAVAGKIISVCDTETPISLGDSAEPVMSLRMENICGSFPGSFENYPSAGALLRPGAPKVGQFIQHRQFVGTHHLFHSVHARLTYRVNQKIFNFKGGRCLEDIVAFVRLLTEDEFSDIYPSVSMLSVTLRTETSLVIDPANSLMQRVLETLFSSVVRMQPRCDDTNNLFFFEVIDWKNLIKVITKDVGGTDDDSQHVLAYMAMHPDDKRSHPTASVGYTRNGVFFVRITFPRGCLCRVASSRGTDDGRKGSGSSNELLCVGGIEPFVQVVVRFIVLVLVKLRIVGCQ